MQELLEFYANNEAFSPWHEILLIAKLIQLGMFKFSDLRYIFRTASIDDKMGGFDYNTLNMLFNAYYGADCSYYTEITRRDVYLYRRTKLNFDVFEKTIINKCVVSKIYDPILDNELIFLIFEHHKV